MDLLWWTNIPGPGWPGAGEKISNFFAQFWKIGLTITETISELNKTLRGWRQYFKLDTRKRPFEEMDIHVRRHLRKLVWIAWKNPKTRERELRRRGLPEEQAWKSSVNGRGAWWNAGAVHMRQAYPNAFFKRQGLYSLLRMA